MKKKIYISIIIEIGRISCCDPSIKNDIIADENGEW